LFLPTSNAFASLEPKNSSARNTIEVQCIAAAAPLQVYASPLSGGGRAVVLANFQTTYSQYPATNITVFWTQIGLQPGQRVAVRDLYEGGRRDVLEWQGCVCLCVKERSAAAWVLHTNLAVLCMLVHHKRSGVQQ
jgi:hypothetical protein